MVQGVAFRYYTVKYARSLSITGTVKNLYNGDVEIFAQGTPGNMEKFEFFLKNGPPSAVVDQVIKEEADSNEVFTEFEIIF